MLRSFINDERGEDLIEYGLLAAFVAAVALAVLMSPGLKAGLSDAIATAVKALTTSF